MKYKLEPLKLLGNPSLKNAHFYSDWSGEYFVATDMLKGGHRVYRWARHSESWTEILHCLPGWIMAWAPQLVHIPDSGTYIYFCDTNGRDISHWWDFMRIYRQRVDLVNKKPGPVERVRIQGGSGGYIDPHLIYINKRWYLFTANLFDADHDPPKYWDITVTSSDNPAGPYGCKQHIGISDPVLVADAKHIDEAPHVYEWGGQLFIYHAKGDSGLPGGRAEIGVLDTIKTSGGQLLFHYRKISKIESVDGSLITAVAVGPDGVLYGTGRHSPNSGSGGRDMFFIGKAIRIH